MSTSRILIQISAELVEFVLPVPRTRTITHLCRRGRGQRRPTRRERAVDVGDYFDQKLVLIVGPPLDYVERVAS